jgi:hypothetical protein
MTRKMEKRMKMETKRMKLIETMDWGVVLENGSRLDLVDSWPARVIFY